MKPNIILVHGILNQGRMFWTMAQHLAKCGFGIPDLKPNTAITSLTFCPSSFPDTSEITNQQITPTIFWDSVWAV